MHRLSLLLALTAALLALVAATAQAAVRGHGGACDPGLALHLDVRAAAAVPGDAGTPVGVAAARRMAAQLTAGSDVCRGVVPASTRRALRAAQRLARRGHRVAARRRFRAVISQVAHRRAARRAPARARAAAGGCPIGQAPTVKPDPRVGQLLAAQGAAELVGDDASAAVAGDAARQAYRDWVGGTRSTSVSDDLVIANGALLLGLDAVADRALERARGRAAADAAREMDAVDSPCEASPDTMRCALKAMMIAELLGVDGAFDTDRAVRMSRAIADRGAGKLGPDCERWTFQMRFTQPADGEGLLEDMVWTWDTGRFDVDRVQGQVFPVQPPGGAGWPLNLNSPAARCIETTDEGKIDHGPVAVTGGAFHYALAGSATSDALSLSLTTADAHLTISFQGDGNVMCGALEQMGQTVTDQFIAAPFELPDLPVPEGQTAYDVADTGFELHLHREI